MADFNDERIVHVAYGKGRIPLRLDPDLARWHVITPVREEMLSNPREAFDVACADPVGAPPLHEIAKPNDRVVIVTSDGTRPVPNRILIPWVLETLNVPLDNVTILLGTGTHRANSPEEIESMFGTDIVGKVAIVNHDAYDEQNNVCVGTTTSGAPAYIDKTYVEAGKRIVLGFIEPHFFAGFSGGPKGIVPGVAGIDSILHLHGYDLIAHPGSTWGELDANPIQKDVREMAAFCPPDFLVNVTLNVDKEITGIFAGHYLEAHREGCKHAKAASMVPVPGKFPIVVTSNSGFPLDQNLYQAVKGMSAAERIVEDGGTILAASECSDGFPDHGNFRAILEKADTPQALEKLIRELDAPMLDQWQAQILARIASHANIAIYSELDDAAVRTAMLEPITDLQSRLEEEISKVGKGCPVAILPEGPITIPYVPAQET